jgi:Xaa-Pro aminopeptidase
MAISANEYNRRHMFIKAKMKNSNLDSLLVVGQADDFNRGNMRYITGFGRGSCCVVPFEGAPIFFTNAMMAKSPKFPNTVEAHQLLDLRETSNVVDQVVKELKRLDKGNRVGLVGINSISVAMYTAVKEQFKDRLVDVNEFLRAFREIKSEEEIEKLETAAAIADKVYLRLREIIRPGLSEFAIYGEVKKIVYSEGCEYSFDLLDAAGSRMNMSFYPTIDKLEANGTLFMEISPSFQGYYAQLPVTLPVGKYQPHVKEMVQSWAEADQQIRQYLKPGAQVKDICAKLVNSIKSKGFQSPLRPGHSVGLDILDFWQLEENSSVVLQANMVIAVHPCSMIMMGGDGVGMGYTYHITQTGYRKFSKIDLAGDLL